MLDSDLSASARWGGESLMLNVVFRQDYGAVRGVRRWPVSDRRLQPSHRRSLRDPKRSIATDRFREEIIGAGTQALRGLLRQRPARGQRNRLEIFWHHDARMR